MTAKILQFKKHLKVILNIDVDPISWKEKSLLPFYLRDLYSFFEIKLMDIPCLLMFDNTKQVLSPVTIRKHIEQIRCKYDYEIVYIVDRITSYNRKRLIEHRVSFVVPGNQTYLPLLGIDLREHFKALRTVKHKFTPSTQVLIIHAINQNKTKRVFTPALLAKYLGYSVMTMTRAFNELESFGLGNIITQGRKRHISFTKPSKEIWDQAQPFLQSPVRMRFYIHPKDTKLPKLKAGLTGLSDYTMLAEPVIPVFAMNYNEWKSLKQHCQILDGFSAEPGVIEIEVWAYSPHIFTTNNTVDRLSLYLSLMHIQDERVEVALEEMMDVVEW
ncbi:hypothetical protein K8T06_17920 [bacterium]|nr:hypothetical protein [bacterium]